MSKNTNTNSRELMYGVGSSSEYYADGTSVGSTLFCSIGDSKDGNIWGYFQDNTDHLLGKILTVVDASYTDKAQREAVKSLIKMSFREYRAPATWVLNSGNSID